MAKLSYNDKAGFGIRGKIGNLLISLTKSGFIVSSYNGIKKEPSKLQIEARKRFGLLCKTALSLKPMIDIGLKSSMDISNNSQAVFIKLNSQCISTNKNGAPVMDLSSVCISKGNLTQLKNLSFNFNRNQNCMEITWNKEDFDNQTRTSYITGAILNDKNIFFLPLSDASFSSGCLKYFFEKKLICPKLHIFLFTHNDQNVSDSQYFFKNIDL